MKKLLALLLLVSVLAMSVNAELIVNRYTNDFAFSSPNNEQIKMCSCETRVDTLIIENTGNFYAQFELNIDSTYPRKVTLAEEVFELAPNHFREVLVYIEDSCNVEGTFDYTVTAVNSFGRVERVHRSINVAQCEIMLLNVEPEEVATGLCQPATFTAELTNVGTFPDTFALDFGAFNEHLVSDVQELYLEPGQTATQDITFQLECTAYGEFTIPFTALSSKVGVGPTLTRTLTVANEYNFGLNVPTSMQACAGATTQIPFTVENAVGVPDDVTLSLRGPRFVSFEGEKTRTVQLQPHGNANLHFAVAPHRVGDYTVELTATDAHGGITKTRELELAVQHCYEPVVEFRSDETTTISSDVTCCGQKEYFVNVQNNGDREQKLQLELNAPSIFVLQERTVSLQPQQNINVPLVANLPCADEHYTAEVRVYPVGQAQINTSATLTVESQTQRTCHMVQIDEDELDIREDAELIPVMVKHTGIQGGNYSITTESTLFSVLEEEIELSPGEHKAIHLVPEVDLTEQEKGRYLTFPTLTLQGLGVMYNEAIGVDLEHVSWLERLLNWLFSFSLAGIGACGKIILVLFALLLVLVGVLLCAYLGLFRLRPMSRTRINFVKTAVLVLLVVFTLSLPFLSVPSADMQYERMANSEATVLEWYQNGQFRVNLDDYFDDPDFDNLVYSASQPRDIRVDIDDSWMTLTPDHNFVGENTMVITASDEKGGITDSPLFLLRVIPKKDLTFFEWLEIWCHHILVLELIAILGVLFFLMLTAREKRLDLRNDNVIVVVPPPKRATKAPVKNARKKATRKAKKTKKTKKRKK